MKDTELTLPGAMPGTELQIYRAGNTHRCQLCTDATNYPSFFQLAHAVGQEIKVHVRESGTAHVSIAAPDCLSSTVFQLRSLQDAQLVAKTFGIEVFDAKTGAEE